MLFSSSHALGVVLVIQYKDKEIQHCRGVVRNSLTPQGEYQAHNSPSRNKVPTLVPTCLGSWGVKPLGELGSYICVYIIIVTDSLDSV